MSRRVLPAVLFGLAILSMSGPWASAEHTGTVTSSWFASLGLPADVAAWLHVAIRKAGHVLAYATFAVLAWRALPERLSPARRGSYGVACAAALATADELLQGLSATRGSSALDVLLDTGAALLAVGVATRIARARAGRPQPSTAR